MIFREFSNTHQTFSSIDECHKGGITDKCESFQIFSKSINYFSFTPRF